ncbi:virion core protein, T7 gp14 family [Megasphaera elsdenii]|uniref:virion core protein, T7 gp14 family n=1 Tax=Megasphaera elsdenii TaxID=907 RepID=UPI000A45EF40|nr:hypothetical protein [Megasphaera elsdenii]
MCGTPWMMALTAIQGINQYNTQKQQYNAQTAMYNAQAKAAEQNARISQVKQEQIAEQYAAQQSKLNDRMKLAAGQTAAQAGASGLQLSGSPLDALSASYGAWNADSAQLLQNQRNDVWSEHLNEVNYQNQANAYRTSAANLQAQKKSALWGTILGTAASMYGIHREYGAGSKSKTDTYNGAYDITPQNYYHGTGHYTYTNQFKQQNGIFTPAYHYGITPVNLDKAIAKYDSKPAIRPVDLEKYY